MNAQDNIAYFNSNDGTGYFCFGSMHNLSFQDTINFELFDQFLQKHKGKFIYGYISYDAKNSIEALESENDDLLGFPTLHFIVPEVAFKFVKDELQFFQGNDTTAWEPFFNELYNKRSDNLNNIPPFSARITKEDYIDHVEQLRNEIQLGNIYEINFCQEYYTKDAEISDSVGLYHTINQITDAPFSVYLKDKNHYAICGSPERYIQKIGSKLISQPIKGTAKRGTTPEEDQLIKEKLAQDPKEISENVMIVDLVRNDFSRIALAKSVVVPEFCKIYSFKTVHQMISTIECHLDDDVSFSSILKASFPMGSMTGAPKISAMNLSEKHESFKRGLYSGSIGYILPNGDFDFNVVIRSILYNAQTNYLSCSVGGAITINSKAEMEYEECQTKVKRLLDGITTR